MFFNGREQRAYIYTIFGHVEDFVVIGGGVNSIYSRVLLLQLIFLDQYHDYKCRLASRTD